MTLQTPHPGAPRNPFQGLPEPEPFYRSPEFTRFAIFAGLLAAFGIVAFLIVSNTGRKAAAELTRAEQQAALPKLISPEDEEARQLRLSSLLEGSLADTQNGTDFVETTGYRKLLQVVASYPKNEFERRAVRLLDYDQSLADPDAWRGEFVWTRGILLNLYAERLRDPVFGMTDVYRGILADGDGEKGLFFDLPGEPPAGLNLRKDPVDVFGIFYRTVQYETLAPEKQGDPQVLTVPYLVIQSIRNVERPKGDPTGFMQDHSGKLLVGAGVVIFTARLLIYLFQRRAKRSRTVVRGSGPAFRDMFDTKIRQEKRTDGPRSET
jgi:hypothetical protein